MYKKNKHIHFIGIGGIGTSGIAAILKQQGYIVSGCDLVENSQILNDLSNLGCQIYHGHHADHIKQADVLVYSSAVSNENSEVQAALKKGIPVIARAIMLAELMRMKYGIAISGSHGKTTTTSMISHILTEAQFDPTIVIGGILKNLSTHAKLGQGDLLIAEADESDRSLLYLNPSIAIVTNIDAEHLDTYKDLGDVQETFKNFLARLPFYGKAIICIDDLNIRSILPLSHINTIKYGLSAMASIQGEIIEMDSRFSIFKVYKTIQKKDSSIHASVQELGLIKLNMPGKHNILNSLAAIALSLELDIPFLVIKKALNSFKGVERRFEYKGLYNGAEIFDDYGHHPTEIRNTLLVARKRAKGKLHVIFQPHRYSRTEKLWNDFVQIFAYGQIDTLFLTDIYPASEIPIVGITSQKLILDIQHQNPNLRAYYYSTYEKITKSVTKFLNKGDLLITIGAGKANCIGDSLIEQNEINIIKNKQQIITNNKL